VSTSTINTFPEIDMNFRPLDQYASWLKGILIAILILALISIISGVLQIDLIFKAASGNMSRVEAAANDAREQIIGILQLIGLIGSAIAFLIWFYRARTNLSSLGGREFKYSPGWTVGGFFVPFLNIVRPLQVMREIWHASNPQTLKFDLTNDGPILRDQLKTPSLLIWWWLLFLASYIIGNVIFRMSIMKNPSFEDLKIYSILVVFSDIMKVFNTIVTLFLVNRLTKWQNIRNDLVTQISANK
jgi:hypothetical protein